MKKQFGEFHVDEHLEFAVDMDRGIFAHARVAAINEHILTLELDQEDGSQRRILGMADRFCFLKIITLFGYALSPSFLQVCETRVYIVPILQCLSCSDTGPAHPKVPASASVFTGFRIGVARFFNWISHPDAPYFN
jgi:hypothetical protein